MNKIWSDKAWDDYLYWQIQDKKTLKRINQLIKDIDRNVYEEYLVSVKFPHYFIFFFRFFFSIQLINIFTF